MCGEGGNADGPTVSPMHLLEVYVDESSASREMETKMAFRQEKFGASLTNSLGQTNSLELTNQLAAVSFDWRRVRHIALGAWPCRGRDWSAWDVNRNRFCRLSR